ncbi:hypothetical protein GCM10009854_18700 [Saccharopolyspora halophila]|uniref:Uncharacterized protein n=1 Tax=Saccharopolyspora halophila TaxID=405551 RepID=A0ABN3G1L2_9PSEU
MSPGSSGSNAVNRADCAWINSCAVVNRAPLLWFVAVRGGSRAVWETVGAAAGSQALPGAASRRAAYG